MSSPLAEQALCRRFAAELVHQAKMKEHEAACWLGLAKNIEEARASVHSAADAVLDATEAQVRAQRAQFSRGI